MNYEVLNMIGGPLVDALAARLRELAAGAEPYRRFGGICCNIENRVDVPRDVETVLVPAFGALGLDYMFPIGGPEEYSTGEYGTGSLWEGFRGECRRTLADCVADWVEIGEVDPDKVKALHAKLRELARQDGRDWAPGSER